MSTVMPSNVILVLENGTDHRFGSHRLVGIDVDMRNIFRGQNHEPCSIPIRGTITSILRYLWTLCLLYSCINVRYKRSGINLITRSSDIMFLHTNLTQTKILDLENQKKIVFCSKQGLSGDADQEIFFESP